MNNITMFLYYILFNRLISLSIVIRTYINGHYTANISYILHDYSTHFYCQKSLKNIFTIKLGIYKYIWYFQYS